MAVSVQLYICRYKMTTISRINQTFLTSACVLTLATVGCGSTQPKERTAASTTGSSTTTAESPSSIIHPVGIPVTFNGTVTNSASAEIRVTLKVEVSNIVDPAENTATPAEQVTPGTRWVTASASMANLGKTTYAVAGGSFTIIDSGGGSNYTNLSSAPWTTFSNSLLVAGDKRTGTIAFLVPLKSNVEEIRWSPVSGIEPIYRWGSPIK